MAYPTDQQIDDAVPVAGTPSRALTNAALKAITANATFLPNEGTVPLRSIENENFSGGRIKATMGTDPDDCVTLLQMQLAIPTWANISGKPAFIGAGTTAATARTAIGAGTSSLILGSASTNAKAGDWLPSWSQVTGKPTLFTIAASAPASATAPGTQWEIFADTDYLYICVATDTWLRTAISAW